VGARGPGPRTTAGRRRARRVDIGITDSYRSYDAQVDVARRKGLYSQGGLAAQPGTSPHGWGVAADLDLDDDAAQRWMRANAGRFGFVEDTPRELWHWVYKT
jgi:LAS superfamily LD-carboxypeptidase LdcB